MTDQNTVKEEKRKTIHKPIDDTVNPELIQPFKELVAQVIGARKVRGLNMSQLAKLSGCSESTVNRFERFQAANINITTVMKLLNVMGLRLVIVPKDVDMKTIREANALLIQYSQTMKGHISE